ncbi:hypothetical protein FHY31_004253 [Xanthomonas euvesicatoria]|uniref:Uncharacterized protein n=1 Tax=Xanthomonas euvesicatoria TaxID=456327 RepID=A0AAW3UA30_XANEU|nr:hypothetical protein [Xanthomonas euvesicatoria]MBB4872434.1 hypothetical protein [Xanthomonas euvesicatoria]
MIDSVCGMGRSVPARLARRPRCRFQWLRLQQGRARHAR